MDSNRPSHGRGNNRRLRVAVLTALALQVALIGGARAAFVEHYADSGDYAYDDCGFLVEGSFEVSGLYQVKQDGREKDNFEFRAIETNPANGKWFVQSGNAMNQDTTTELVEGTIYRFTVIEAGQPYVITDMNGNVVIRDRGVRKATYLLDTQGDDDPTNDEVVPDSFEQIAEHGQFPSGAYFSEHEWCDLVHELIG